MKLKEYYTTKLEDDLEFELGYLEYLRDKELSQMEKRPQHLNCFRHNSQKGSKNENTSLSGKYQPINNTNYNNPIGA